MAEKKISYNQAFSELEQILVKLENNELDVDKLAAEVKRASELISLCKNKLHTTEEEIEKIMESMDKEED
jgi:exodeoxyribonuclease VII small subunit